MVKIFALDLNAPEKDNSNNCVTCIKEKLYIINYMILATICHVIKNVSSCTSHKNFEIILGFKCFRAHSFMKRFE